MMKRRSLLAAPLAALLPRVPLLTSAATTSGVFLNRAAKVIRIRGTVLVDKAINVPKGWSIVFDKGASVGWRIAP